MLQIKNLTIHIKNDLRTLIDDLSFTLQEGDKVGLIGEEGNGKTVLLKAIADPDALKDNFDVQGEISKAGEILGYLPQVATLSNLERTTHDVFQAAFPYGNLDWDLYFTLLHRLDFPEARIRPDLTLRQLSGGEKIKFLLLLELLKKPTLLLLDEPTNDLDLDAVLMLENLIQESEIPVIFVSHDEMLLENCANTIIHLSQLRHKTRPQHTIARLGYSDYIRAKKEGIIRQTKLAVKEKEEYEAKLRRYQRIQERVKHDLRATKLDTSGRLLAKKMKTVKAQERRLDKEKGALTQKPDVESPIMLSFFPEIDVPGNKDILRLDLPVLQAGDTVLARDIKLDIIGPEKICIIGANGTGKTTLLRRILPELDKLNIRYGYMPQDYTDRMDPEGSAIDYLTVTHMKDEHTRIRTFLGCLNFTPEEMLRPIATLSGGQRAKLFFSQMILNRAEVLVLDEPTRNLSPLSGPEIRAALDQFGGGIIAVSHDRRFIRDVFDKVLLLDAKGLHHVHPDDLFERS